MKRTIFKIVISLFLVLFTIQANAQQNFIVSLKMPPPGTLNTSDFYNVTVTNNSGSDQSGYLVGTAKEDKDGMIAKGTTVPMMFKKGVNNIKIKDLPKTPDVEYLASNPKYKESLIRQGKFPSGNYEICVKVISAATNEELGSDCINQEVLETGLLSLMSPANGENIDSKVPVTFTWSSGGKVPEGGYTLRICEVMNNQTPEIAMKSNKAFFEQEGLRSSTFTYPNSGKGFEVGTKYAWTVSGGNVYSEVYNFSLKGASVSPLRTLVLQNGIWEASINKCDCNQAADCFCHIISYATYYSFNEIPRVKEHTYAVISSAVLNGNTLSITFTQRLNKELKSNNFRQDQEVILGSDLCKELGYSSIAILPGDYTIKDNISMTLNVRLDPPPNQLKTLILQQGNYQSEVQPVGCSCGMGQFDCVCGLTSYNIYSNVEAIHLSLGQIYVVVASQIISRNTLNIKFADKLNMNLRTNDFIQKKEVIVATELSKELGYSSITILPGNYTIKDGNSISLNVKLNKDQVTLKSPKLLEPTKDKNKIKFEWDGNIPKEGFALSIFEIDENQYKEISKNKNVQLKIEKPLFERTGIRENYFTFSDSSINLQDGHHYGWGVRNGSRSGPWSYHDWNTMTATAAVLNPLDLHMVTEFIEVWGDNLINGSYNNIKDADEGDGQYLNGIINPWGYPVFHIAWKIDPANVDPSYEGQEFIIKIVKLPRGPVADGYQKPDGTWVYPSSGPSCTGDAYFWHDPNDLNSVNNELNVFQSFRAYYNSNYSQYFVNMASSPPFDMLEIGSQYCCKVSLGNITSNCFMFTFAP